MFLMGLLRWGMLISLKAKLKRGNKMLDSIIQNENIEETSTKDLVGSLSSEALSQLFLDARTHHGWQDQPVSDLILCKLYELVKWAPTCVNGSPARILFI